MVSLTPTLQQEYNVLAMQAGIVRLPSRSMIRVMGNDRASFLHNLCTNEVKALRPRQGCEAFVTNVQGKTIGHVALAVDEDAILLHTVADQSELLTNHLDRYLITEDVQLQDLTAEWQAMVVAGPDAVKVLGERFQADKIEPPYATATAEFENSRVVIQSIPWAAGNCFMILTPSGLMKSLDDTFIARGAKPVSEEAIDTVRIENAFPFFGVDISENNLPQEIDRNDLAISFTKGCYLGQETVARIDALGHVNKKLVQVKIDGDEVPECGSAVIEGDQEVGQVTSACVSPRFQSVIALAIVRCKSIETGDLSCQGKRLSMISE